MAKQSKRVLVVQEGRFGVGHYKSFVEQVIRQPLEQEGAKIEVVDYDDEAKEMMERERFDIVVYVSVDMIHAARVMRARFPQAAIFVLVGTSVDDQPYLVPKQMLRHGSIQGMLDV